MNPIFAIRHFLAHRGGVYVFAAVLLLLVTLVPADAQVAPFMGLGNAQFFDNGGHLLTAGVLYSFQAGTTTQQATYTDSTGLIFNPNPIPFGSGARVSIWLTSSLNYKFVLCVQNDGATCAPADVLFSVDQVPGSPAGSSGASPFTGTFISGSATPATTGILRLASADAVCWRTAAGTANLCITKSSNDVLTLAGVLSIQQLLSSCANAALTGTIRFCTSDSLNWRNNANTGDLALSKSASDNLLWPNGLSLGGGTPLATTNQSGTGNLVLQTAPTINNPVLNSPSLNGVVVTGTPSASQTLCASNSTAAGWCSAGITKDFSVTGCTTAASTDSSCTGSITISPAFADTSYIPVLTINSVNGAFVSISISGSLVAGSIPYTITCTFNCGAIVAPTIYVHAFHP